MLKREYFIKALQARAYAWPEFIHSIFGRVLEYGEGREFDYQLFRKEGKFYFTDPEFGGKLNVIDDADANDMLLEVDEEFIIRKGDLSCVTKNQETNYGAALFNAVLINEPFKGAIEYVGFDVSVKDLESKIAKGLTTPPKNDSERKEGVIYTDTYTDVYGKNFLYMLDFLPVFAPAASPRNLVGNPKAKAHRDKRLKELKAAGKSDDKAEIARLNDELIELDKEWTDGDFGRDWLATVPKVQKNARLKMHGLVGIDGDFGDTEAALIGQSLSEGIDPKTFHAAVNTGRSGSFSRSHETQISGAKVKEIARALQNERVDMDDCGVTYGDKILVTESDYKDLLSLYYFRGKESVLITEDNAKSLVGKTIEVRSPAFCKSKKLCKKCVGDNISRNPNDVASTVTSIMTTFVQATMKKMHDSTIQVAKLDLESVCY